MKVSARVQNSEGQHRVTLRTEDRVHSLTISPKRAGLGSSTSGGELLFLALATCYCNDLYREAAKRGLEIEGIEVEVEGADIPSSIHVGGRAPPSTAPPALR